MKKMLFVLVLISVLLITGLMRFSRIIHSTYPIKVTFNFVYDGQPTQVSYLTVGGRELGNFPISKYRYTERRSRVSFRLPDDSLILLKHDWTIPVEAYEVGRIYPSGARWFWQDRIRQPRQIIYGDGATRSAGTRSTPAPFTWLAITATIERLPDAFLSDAIRADTVNDTDDSLVFSNLLGGASNYRGTLFTSLVIQPLSAADPNRTEALKSAPGWISGSGNCRFKSIQQEEARSLSGLVNFADRVGLLLDGTSWSAKGGPRPGEPLVMYVTGVHVEVPEKDFSILPFRTLVTGMMNTIEWDGAVCRDLRPPDSPFGIVVEFENGRLSWIEPSDDVAVLRD